MISLEYISIDFKETKKFCNNLFKITELILFKFLASYPEKEVLINTIIQILFKEVGYKDDCYQQFLIVKIKD